MGTNYYFHKPLENVCECCGRSDPPEIIHIGKSSWGWCFGLHVIPEEGINDLPDWQSKWSEGTIKNEYGDVIDKEEMLSIITERSHPVQSKWDKFDYQFNHAVPGPKNLVRHKLDSHCLSHGEGTWDCITGKFS